MENKNLDMKPLYFIEDEERNLFEDEDLLGTKPYAVALKKIIESRVLEEGGFTIGLYGSWGAGKSTIIKSVEKALEDNDTIKCVKYDAWKYSNDDFRRSFLINLNTQTGHNIESSKLEQLFYSDLRKDLGFKLKPADNASWIIVYIFFILLEAYAIFSKDIFKIFISTFSGILLYITQRLFVQLRTQSIISKTFSAEQFENQFKDIISKTVSGEVKTVKNFKPFLYTNKNQRHSYRK